MQPSEVVEYSTPVQAVARGRDIHFKMLPYIKMSLQIESQHTILGLKPFLDVLIFYLQGVFNHTQKTTWNDRKGVDLHSCERKQLRCNNGRCLGITGGQMRDLGSLPSPWNIRLVIHDW